MKLLRTRYRIVLTKSGNYEAQYRLWWYPFWLECHGLTTHKFGGGLKVSSKGGCGFNICDTAYHAHMVVEAHKKARAFRRQVVWQE